MSLYDDFVKLDIEIVENFRSNGKSTVIPLELQRFIIHIIRAFELMTLNSNVTGSAKILMSEFKGEIKTFANARKLVYDAINYFCTNEPVKNEVWNSLYADKLDNLALLAIKNDDYKTAATAYEKAHRLRTLTDENQIDPDLLRPPVFVITADISHKELGFEKNDLKQISKKHTDGFYSQLIDNLPIDELEKIKLRKDANIEDTEYEELKDE